MPRLIRLAVAASLLVVASAEAQQASPRWFRGNTHAHTWNSDGDSPPHVVAQRYRELGYHFLFVTDHEYITDVAPLNALFGATGRFLVLPGQEVSQRVADSTHPDRARQAHVNALGTTRVIFPEGERYLATTSIAQTYARNLALITQAGGVPQVNHPNFRWSVPMEEMLALPDGTLFELWNGYSLVYNLGGSDSLGNRMPSTEELWDSLLTRGKLLYGVADDDSHSYRPEGADNPDLARPGRGWVMVRADTLTAGAILDGLRRGDFYSSTGVTLRDYHADAAEIRLEMVPVTDRRYLTEFIGSGGRVLAAVPGLRARYAIQGTEGYVRVRVTASNGGKAWTQPVRVAR